MRYAVLHGGKRFRPLLCLAACDTVGGDIRLALPTACGLECIHAYSLIHDDLPAMDDADERRGQPSCHRKYGEAIAILAGDALVSLGMRLTAQGDGAQRQIHVVQEISEAIGTSGLIGGQVEDLLALRRGGRLTARQHRKRLDTISARKTGRLIVASVKAGAVLGGASHREVARLEGFGRDVGLAFQVTDDLLDGEGYAIALGRGGANRLAHRLIQRALCTLEPWGRGAESLRALALQVIERTT